MRMADYKRAKEELRAARIAMHLQMNYVLWCTTLLRHGPHTAKEREEIRVNAKHWAFATTTADFLFNNA